MSATISPPMFLQFMDPNNSGSPLAGGQLFIYQGGTSTKATTWTDITQVTQNANPIQLDANGIANVWLDPTKLYKFVLAPKGDTDPPASAYRTVDNISGSITLTTLTQVLIGSILYPQTPAEAAASVTPINNQYDEGIAFRYIDPSQHAFILTNNTGSQNGALVAAGIQNCINVTAGKKKRFYNGTYFVKPAASATIACTQNQQEWDFDQGATFVYDDTNNVGSFCLTYGKAGSTTTGLSTRNLQIDLNTATACGLKLLNCTGSYHENALISGYQGGFVGRSNISVQLTSESTSVGCWFNVFNYLYLPHHQTGIKVTAGGITTRNNFSHLYTYGDANNGCTNAIAVDAACGSYFMFEDVWLEQIGAAGYGMRMINSSGGGATGPVSWKVYGLVCDAVTTALYFDTQIADNKFRDTEFAGAVVTDNSATNSGNEYSSDNVWDTSSVSTANNTTKSRFLSLKHYASANTSFLVLGAFSGASVNQIEYGGGESTRTAATLHSFYTAANNNTTTGTEVFRVDNSTTAADTRMMVWDVNKAALSRVSVGANDSGGAGFKLLRVPN